MPIVLRTKHESTEWKDTSGSSNSESEIVASTQLTTKQPATKEHRLKTQYGN